MKRKKRCALTLVEVMLVIVLIGIIGGTLAFNLRGALDKGKAFKTKEMQRKIETIVNIAALEDEDADIANDWENIVLKSPLLKVKLDKNKKITDGWGTPFSLEYDLDKQQFVAKSLRIDTDGKIIDTQKARN